MTTAQTYEFKSEARQLLDLMIHSLYSNKEVFLRELISNSSDALDKLRFESLTDKALIDSSEHPFEIRLHADAEARTLTISDSGIGMSRDEVINNLGTIARSGTREFVEKLRDAKTDAQTDALIGQFGVGFYSSFMVADAVTVVTRRAGETTATRWSSKGDGVYEIEDAERDAAGTSVTLHLRDTDVENGLQDFTQEWVVRSTVKKYSDFVQHPILLEVTHEERPKDDEGNPIEDADPIKRTEWETVNSQKAIWTRPTSEVTDEEYEEFYKHIARDWNAPLDKIVFKAEGTFEYYALLFFPERAPFDLFYRNVKFGLQLHVNRVMVMEQCEDLLPDYLRFMKGIVDSPDLSLNVSREMLQHDRRVAQIRKRITKKILDSLDYMRTEETDNYLKFWNAFGAVLKEGVSMEYDHGDKLKKILWFESTSTDKDTDTQEAFTTLEDYVSRMPEGQDKIYYITGESRDAAERSPHLEAFLAKNYEVLFLTDPIDEIMVGQFTEFDGKKLQSISKGAVDLNEEDNDASNEEKTKEHASLLEYIQSQLEEHIKEVRLSHRLTTSPVCLVSEDNDMSPRLQRMLQQAGQANLPDAKRILEINPDHPILGKMQTLYNDDATSATLSDYAHLLHGQALLAEGSPLPDPVTFGKRVAELMVRI